MPFIVVSFSLFPKEFIVLAIYLTVATVSLFAVVTVTSLPRAVTVSPLKRTMLTVFPHSKVHRCFHRFIGQQHRRSSQPSKLWASFDGIGSDEIGDTSHLTEKGSQINDYWIKQLKLIDRIVAKELIQHLRPDNPLGYVSDRTGSPAKKGTLVDFTIEKKMLYPDKVILLRSGEFYESYGIDALMLIAYSGLNPMGGRPKAGCPVKNIQATLDGMTNAGLSIAVFEEINDADASRGPTSSKTKIKQRELAQIVSPCSTTYAYDLCLQPEDIDFRENRPAVGILKTVNGFTVCEVHIDERILSISERLTDEAVKAMLATSGFIEPILLQDVPSDELLFLASHFVQRLSGYSEKSFIDQVAARVGRSLEINTSDFRQQRRSFDNRPRPIYMSTALQIGLLANDNVPVLVPCLLPNSFAPAYASRFLRQWIMNPPPRDICAHMQSMCRELSQRRTSIPKCNPILEGKTVSLLTAGQCNVALFRDTCRNVKIVSYILNSLTTEAENININSNNNSNHVEDVEAIENKRLLQHLLPIIQFKCGIAVSASQLKAGCEEVINKIDRIIVSDSRTHSDDCSSDPHDNIPADFFLRNEEIFRGSVMYQNEPQIKRLYQEIAQAAAELSIVVDQDFAGNLRKDNVIFDINNNAIMLRAKPPGWETNSMVEYIHPTDRNGLKLSKRYTTARVEQALRRYLFLTKEAPQVITKTLQTLSKSLLVNLVPIIQSSHFAVILQSINAHVISSTQKGWSLPNLVTADPKKRVSMDLIGLTPYWIDRTSAIANDVSFDGIILLTAPNMSGKSTLMRSIIVISILANCGLFVPANKQSNIPTFDCFFLRTASYDIPSEGKSAFALEMDDVRVIQRDATSQSLVMIDELGKGTSANQGTALSGAILEYLDRKAVYTIFATHWHELFSLPLKLNNILYKRMNVTVNARGHADLSYRLEEGICTDSMAVHTARQYGISPTIITRTEELSKVFDDLCRPNSFTMASRNQVPQAVSVVHHIEPELLVSTARAVDLKEIAAVMKTVVNSGTTRVVVKPDQLPPASLEGKAAVYVLILRDDLGDLLYVGETESISQRLQQHRRSKLGYSITTLILNVDNKSVAREKETLLIRRFKELGFTVDQDSDGQHQLFGSST